MRNIFVSFKFLLKSHLTALLFFELCRSVQLYVCRNLLREETTMSDIFECMLRGLAFDNHTSCVCLIIPALLLLFVCPFFHFPKSLVKGSVVVTVVMYFISFAICCANIPYIAYQNAYLDLPSIMAFFTSSEVFSMVLSFDFVLYILFGFSVSLALPYIVYRYSKGLSELDDNYTMKWNIPVVGFLLFTLFFLGIRGRQSKMLVRQKRANTWVKRTTNYIFGLPLNEHWSVYSDDMILNLCCCNSAYSLERSIHYSRKINNFDYHFMDDDDAYKIAMSKMNYPRIVSDSLSVDSMSVDSVKHPCVILVMMEGMTAEYLTRFGYTKNATPFLDSIYNVSHSYTRFFSAGTHTKNGFFSLMSSTHAMSEFNSLEKIGTNRKLISTAFSDAGYHTLLFVSHEAAYDHLASYISEQTFDNVYDMDDFESDSVTGAYGASDRYVYNYAFNKIDSLYKGGTDKPVFTYLYSCSNHHPYSIPKEYMNRFDEDLDDVLYFTDDQYRMIYNKVRATDWGKDAMFVFVSDHGRSVGKVDCSAPTCLNHISLIINSPNTEACIDTTLGCQSDVVPTVLSKLGLTFADYNGMGIDLTNTDRDTIFYSNDTYYIGRTHNRLYLYDAKNNSHEVWNLTDGIIPSRSEEQDDEALDKFVKATLQLTYKYVRE